LVQPPPSTDVVAIFNIIINEPAEITLTIILHCGIIVYFEKTECQEINGYINDIKRR